MALVKCRECGKSISDQAPACPACGAPLDPADTLRAGAKWERLGFGAIVVGLIAALAAAHWGPVLMAVGFVLFLIGRLQGNRSASTEKRGWRNPFATVVVLLVAGVGAAIFLAEDPAPAAPLTPEQIRERQIQAAVVRGRDALVARLEYSMHDPDSFKRVDDRYTVADDHITMVMTYRGRNAFNAVRTARVAATFDLQGNITSVQPIED